MGATATHAVFRVVDSDADGGTSKSAPPSVVREPIAMTEHRAPPPSFICPLTLELMVDPVTAADGHSYESAAIKQWLQSSALSPLTTSRNAGKGFGRERFSHISSLSSNASIFFRNTKS